MTGRHPRTVLAAALALAGALALGACSESKAEEKPDLAVEDAYVPQPVMKDMAGGFLTVENSGGRDDTLTRVTSDVSDDVQLHRTVDQQMQRVTSLPVPAEGELELSRGGSHIMLLDLKRKPVEGDTIALKLHFETHDPIEVSVPVMAANHTGDAGHGGGDKHGNHGKQSKQSKHGKHTDK